MQTEMWIPIPDDYAPAEDEEILVFQTIADEKPRKFLVIRKDSD